MTRREGLSASGPMLAAALLWGTLWIPLRALDAAGPETPLWTAAGFALPLALLAPVAVRRWRAIRRAGPALPAAGLGLALSISLYAEALVRGSVARVVLLFYLMPVWTTLFARLHRAQPITSRRLAGLALALAGLAAIYGPAVGGPVVEGAAANASADWMGLVAGLAWAATLVFWLPAGGGAPFDRVLAQFAFLAPVYLAVAALPGAAPAAAPAARELGAPHFWVVAFALVWLLPAVWLTVVGASRLEAGRAALLLMLEVAVAIASAAVLAGEALGWREALGAALIVGACALEWTAPAARRP